MRAFPNLEITPTLRSIAFRATHTSSKTSDWASSTEIIEIHYRYTLSLHGSRSGTSHSLQHSIENEYDKVI
jgi:uncharacterized protein YfaT (DUF1175 family)